MKRALPLRRIGRDESGVTIVEFAMILPALCVLLLGIFELGYRSYAGAVIQGALHEAARMATVGGVTQAQIDAMVVQRLSNFASHGEAPVIETTSYFEFSGVGVPEQITSDTDPVGEYNLGDCFIDANGSGEWESDGGSAGMGNSEDVVRYRVSLTLPTIVPVAGFLGWEDMNTIAAETVLRNQPFASRGGPVTTPICPE